LVPCSGAAEILPPTRLTIAAGELMTVPGPSGSAKTTLPRQMLDDIQLQVSPTLAAAMVVVLAIVTGLFCIVEYMRPRE